MTVKVVGHWELGWRSPINEFDVWIHPLKEFGLDEFYMVPVSGISKSRCLEKTNLQEVFAETDQQNFERVFVDENATVELPDFNHPTNALYVIGRTGFSPYMTEFREGIDHAVKIPSMVNNGGFWGEQAAIMILYDRFLKER